MFSLIYKDIILLKKYLLISILFVVAMIYMGCNEMRVQSTGVVFSIFLITYINLYCASGKDERNKSEIVLNSFPINRSTIVIEKYLNVLLISFFIWFLELIISLIFGFANVGHYRFNIKLEYLTISMFLLNLYFAIYYPCYFKFGLFKLRSFNNFIYIIIMLIPSLINRFKDTYVVKVLIEGFNRILINNYSLYILFLFSMILFLSSMIISINIYSKREI